MTDYNGKSIPVPSADTRNKGTKAALFDVEMNHKDGGQLQHPDLEHIPDMIFPAYGQILDVLKILGDLQDESPHIRASFKKLQNATREITEAVAILSEA